MSVGPEFVSANWGNLLNGGELLDLAWETSNPSLLAPISLDRSLPSHRGRTKARLTLMRALDGGRALETVKFLTWSRNRNRNHGALLVSNSREYNGAIGNQKRAELIPAAWQVNAVSRRYFERFLSLAKSQGIHVYLLIPPLSPSIESERDRAGLYEPFDAFVREEQRRFPALTVLDGRRSGYGLSAFADEAHLNRRGALALSEDVARKISVATGTERPRPRWIPLSPFRDPASRPGIEDVEQSLGIVLSGTGKMRR